MSACGEVFQRPSDQEEFKHRILFRLFTDKWRPTRQHGETYVSVLSGVPAAWVNTYVNGQRRRPSSHLSRVQIAIVTARAEGETPKPALLTYQKR